jgi:hypothetical protein
MVPFGRLLMAQATTIIVAVLVAITAGLIAPELALGDRLCGAGRRTLRRVHHDLGSKPIQI